MNILNEILDRYLSADMGTRLNIYLQYRDARNEFFRMDICPDEDAKKIRRLSKTRNSEDITDS